MDRLPTPVFLGFPCGSAGKESACNVGDLGSSPALGRSPGEGNGNPLQCSCLENPRDRAAWWAAVYGVAQSRTRLKRLSSSSSSSSRDSYREGNGTTLQYSWLENPMGRGARDQIANIRWIIEKGREFQKNIYFCFIDYTKAFDCVDHNKPWKILKEMAMLLSCFSRVQLRATP